MGRSINSALIIAHIISFFTAAILGTVIFVLTMVSCHNSKVKDDEVMKLKITFVINCIYPYYFGSWFVTISIMLKIFSKSG